MPMPRDNRMHGVPSNRGGEIGLYLWRVTYYSGSVGVYLDESP